MCGGSGGGGGEIIPKLHGLSMLADRPVNIGMCSIIIPTSISFEETSSYWSVQFISIFQWSASIGEHHMTLVCFVKTTESNMVCR